MKPKKGIAIQVIWWITIVVGAISGFITLYKVIRAVLAMMNLFWARPDIF